MTFSISLQRYYAKYSTYEIILIKIKVSLIVAHCTNNTQHWPKGFDMLSFAFSYYLVILCVIMLSVTAPSFLLRNIYVYTHTPIHTETH
jgi:hypothetical protein